MKETTKIMIGLIIAQIMLLVLMLIFGINKDFFGYQYTKTMIIACLMMSYIGYMILFLFVCKLIIFDMKKMLEGMKLLIKDLKYWANKTLGKSTPKDKKEKQK